MPNALEVLIIDAEEAFGKLKAALSPAIQADVKAVENEEHAIVTDAVTYIKANALQDFEQLAIIFVSAMVPGASWTAMLSALKDKAIADGIALVEGAESIVAAKVQADLLVQGKTPAPVSVPAPTSAPAA